MFCPSVPVQVAVDVHPGADKGTVGPAIRHDVPMILRDASPSDHPAILDLAVQVQALHAAGRPDLFRAPDRGDLGAFVHGILEGEDIVLVAEDAGAEDARAEGPGAGPSVIGYIYAQHLERPQNAFQLASSSLYVHHIAVDGGARHRGVGAALLDAVARRARAVAADAVRLDSWAFNEDAHGFFRAQGFETSRVVFERGV